MSHILEDFPKDHLLILIDVDGEVECDGEEGGKMGVSVGRTSLGYHLDKILVNSTNPFAKFHEDDDQLWNNHVMMGLMMVTLMMACSKALIDIYGFDYSLERL